MCLARCILNLEPLAMRLSKTLLLLTSFTLSLSIWAQPGSYHYQFAFNLFSNGEPVDTADGFTIKGDKIFGETLPSSVGEIYRNHRDWRSAITEKTMFFVQYYIADIPIIIISPENDTMRLTYHNGQHMDHFHFMDSLEFQAGEFEVSSLQFAQNRIMLGNSFFLNASEDSAGYKIWYGYYDNDTSRLCNRYVIDPEGGLYEHLAYQPDGSWHIIRTDPKYVFRGYFPDNRLQHYSSEGEIKEWNHKGQLIYHKINDNGVEKVIVDRRPTSPHR